MKDLVYAFISTIATFVGFAIGFVFGVEIFVDGFHTDYHSTLGVSLILGLASFASVLGNWCVYMAVRGK